MALADTASRLGGSAQGFLQNQYAQERLNEAIENLRAAYKRGSKRRVKPAEDRKLREQVRNAAIAAAEAASAIRTGPKKPRKRARKLLIMVGVTGVGAAAALAMDESLRNRMFEEMASKLSGDDVGPTHAGNGSGVATTAARAPDESMSEGALTGAPEAPTSGRSVPAAGGGGGSNEGG
jgi:hypothetical protein